MSDKRLRLWVALLVVAFFAIVIGVEWAVEHLQSAVTIERVEEP